MIEVKKIGLKIATKDEALWIRARDAWKTKVEETKENLIIAKEFLKTAEKKVIQEAKKQ